MVTFIGTIKLMLFQENLNNQTLRVVYHANNFKCQKHDIIRCYFPLSRKVNRAMTFSVHFNNITLRHDIAIILFIY